MLNDFKFRNHYWLRNDLVDWLEALTCARFKVDEIDLVLPMPATLFHRFDRGYNQCDILGRVLAKRLKKPYRGRVLRRTGHPRRQGGLAEEERHKNVIGTFAVRCPETVCGQTVLVVDDIMTTGATLAACSAALKDAGAARVWCVTVARSLRS